MTYYKYADRNVSQQVNYAEAAKGVVDILDQETAIREQKKQAIDDASAKLGEQIANAPFGQNQTLSTWTINAMEGAMAERLTQDQLLKSGRITLAEYTKRRQSLTESWGSMLGTLRNYNKIYDAHMDAFTSGKASKLQAWNMEQGDNFTNFNNTQAVIDPATGSVNIAKKKDDGTGVLKVSNDPKDIVNVVNLNKFLQTPIPKFNVVEAVEKYADATANSWQELINKGGIQTIDDIRKNPNFKKSKELWLNSLLQNEFEAGSIFVDWYQDETNQEIEITMDASKQGLNTLLLVPSPSGIPTPKLTDAQKKMVVEKMGEMYDVMLSRKITPMVERSGGSGLTEAQLKSRSGKAVAKSAVNAIGMLYTGDSQTKQQALSNLVGIDPTIIDAQYSDNQVIITKMDKDGNMVTIPIEIYPEKGVRNFITALSPHIEGLKEFDLETALRDSGVSADAKYRSGSAAIKKDVKRAVKEMTASELTSIIDGQNTSDEERAAAIAERSRRLNAPAPNAGSRSQGTITGGTPR